MDAPPGSVELEQADELERLRRRAYGPDADIAGDAAAQARLSELEAARRPMPAPVGDAAAGVPAAIPERVPVAEFVGGSRTASSSVPQPAVEALADHGPARTSSSERYPATGSTDGSAAIDRAPTTPWWRRRQPLVIVGVAIAILAVNVAVPASISQLLADPSPRIPAPSPTATAESLPVPSGQEDGRYEPAPDHVLALVSEGAPADQPADPGDKLGALGISPGGLKRYENLYGPDLWGYVTVWSGESRYGLSCLLLSASGQPISDGGRAAEGCSLTGSDAIADISGSDSLIRFVLKGDHIDVYMYEGGADPNASRD